MTIIGYCQLVTTPNTLIYIWGYKYGAFFFSSRRRHTRLVSDWSSDVCSSDLIEINGRPWWYVEFAHRSGVDVLSMAYRDALGLSVPTVRNYQVGRRAVFALNDLRGWRQQNGASPSLPSLLQSWLTSDSTPFHWNDPLPALSYLRQTCVAFFRIKRPDLRPPAPRIAEVTL